MIRRAATPPPVKLIFAIPGCETSAAPTSGPKPVTTFSAPGGRTSPSSVATSTTLGEANSDGLSTSVFPAASAGAIFCALVISGEFHGMMAAITPNGSRVVKTCEVSSSVGIVMPPESRTMPAK